MYYVYLLRSQPHPAEQYVGLTCNLRKRVVDHNVGYSPHTSKFRPWDLVAYFAFVEKRHATAFERYLKTGSRRAFIKRHFRWPAFASSKASGEDWLASDVALCEADSLCSAAKSGKRVEECARRSRSRYGG